MGVQASDLKLSHRLAYEPIQWSVPDIAGMLRTSFGDEMVANRIESAVERVLDDGLRTADLGVPSVGTREMGDAIVARL